MNKKIQVVLFIVTVLLVVILVPIVVPVPPLQNILQVEEIQYSNSQFLPVEGVDIHFTQTGDEPPLIILLHGFGSSTYSWEKVSHPLANYGTVLAYDRPAFGLSERPLLDGNEEINPYSKRFQYQIIDSIRGKYGSEKVILVGNSAGATVAIQYALEFPENVTGLILVDPAVYGNSGPPRWVGPLLGSPLADKWGPFLVRTIQEQGLELLKMAWSNETLITETDLENYQKPLKMANWDIGLWEYTKTNRQNEIEDRLSSINMPVLVLSGADDRIIPPENSRRVASEIAGADYIELPACGHVPQEECPEAFFEAIQPFLMELMP